MRKLKIVQIGLIITTMMIYLGAHLLQAFSYQQTKVNFAGLIVIYVITIVDILLLLGFIISFTVIVLILSEVK